MATINQGPQQSRRIDKDTWDSIVGAYNLVTLKLDQDQKTKGEAELDLWEKIFEQRYPGLGNLAWTKITDPTNPGRNDKFSAWRLSSNESRRSILILCTGGFEPVENIWEERISLMSRLLNDNEIATGNGRPHYGVIAIGSFVKFVKPPAARQVGNEGVYCVHNDEDQIQDAIDQIDNGGEYAPWTVDLPLRG